MVRVTRKALLRGGVALGVAVALAVPARAADEDTRALMQEIFAAFATLVDHVDDPEDFASLGQREEIVRSLQALERNAERLEAHAGQLTPAHRPVGRSLTDDVKRALDHFITGHFESARFLSSQLVENCFACHSKLPTAHRFRLGAELIASEPVAALPPERRALLAVAARQFETALDLLESYLADTSEPAIDIALSGAFESYLKVALRVLGDRERAVRTLAAFRGRGDLPFYLDAEVEGWIATLRGLDPAAPEGDLLVRARDLATTARLVTAYPGDRRGLPQFVVASRWLHQRLEAGGLAPAELSETFLWLGLCEVHISSSLWVSEAESFLENAIRAAPDTPHARMAYTILEAVYLEGHTGSGGTHLPSELERRLEQLRGLVAGPPGVSGP